MTFTPIFAGFSQKPKSQYFRGSATHNGFRDQLSIPTWLMLGALIQGLLAGFLPYQNLFLVAPLALVFVYKIGTTALQTAGLLRNPYIDGAIMDRTAILYADEHGQHEKPGDAEICAIMLASRCNHPLGMFAYGFKELGDRFTAMTTQLDADPTKYGYLGSSTWINSSDRTTGNEQMVFIYFKSLHDCHEYAHGPMHTDTMQWWQQNYDKLKHIGIMHEVFAAPKHANEGIYVNYHPTGLGATFTEATVKGEKMWMSPLVQGKGKLTYSKGRMGRAMNEKSEWTAFEDSLGERDRV